MRRKKSKTERKLQIVRLFMYTLVSFVLFQYIGIFALADIKGIYVTSDSRLNAFSPKAYVSVDLVEEDTTNHKYLLDSDGYAFYEADKDNDDTDERYGKSVYVSNPGTNKKNVVVRAQIVANICNKQGVTIGQTQKFKVIGDNLTGYETTGTGDDATSTEIVKANMWYHPKASVATKTDKDGNEVKEGTYSSTNSESTKLDTYFYYTSVLEKGSETTNLFDNVRLTDISCIPEDGYVEFHVIIDTVEVNDNYTASDDKYYDKVKTAWGETAMEEVKRLITYEAN